jgi:hypothetical protein
MKLILCPHCTDVRKLLVNTRTVCECGKSFGQYTDEINAEIGGDAIPLGLANASLALAIRNRPQSGMGKEFTAFVIPREVSSIRRITSEVPNA